MIAMLINRNIYFGIIQLGAVIFFAGYAATTYAAVGRIDLNLHTSRFTSREAKSFMLVSNDANVFSNHTEVLAAAPTMEFSPPIITKRTAHQYFGLTTIALAGLTAITAPEDCEETSCSPRNINGIHATFAKATIAMAIATIASGLYAHWDDFSLSDGWSDPDNLHILLGATGAALMAYAVNKSANSQVPVSHAGIAEAGAVLMVVAIKLTW